MREGTYFLKYQSQGEWEVSFQERQVQAVRQVATLHNFTEFEAQMVFEVIRNLDVMRADVRPQLEGVVGGRTKIS